MSIIFNHENKLGGSVRRRNVLPKTGEGNVREEMLSYKAFIHNGSDSLPLRFDCIRFDHLSE